MTDHEILSLFNEMAANTQGAFMNFVAILSAFLIAGYLAAHRLSKTMTVILTVLFSVVAVQEGLTVLFHWGDQIGLMVDMRSRETLSWRGASRGGPWLGAIFNSTFGFTVIGGYIGALIFFFHQRRVGLKLD